jgi:hypothetical protein
MNNKSDFNLLNKHNNIKQTNYLKLDRTIFVSNKSFLFKNNIIDELTKYLLLQIESNNVNDSCIRFCVSSSIST